MRSRRFVDRRAVPRDLDPCRVPLRRRFALHGGSPRQPGLALRRGLLAAVLIACTLAAGAAHAQTGTVTGRVVNDATRAPVGEATVIALAPNASTTTDADGRFELTGLAAGDHELVAQWGDLLSDIVRVTVGAGTPVDVVLSISFQERVVVTATRTRQGLDEVPIRTEVMSAAAMQEFSARTLADAVEYINGVRVESNCQNCNFSQIRLLGLEGPYTQILIDSQPVISSLAQVYGIEQIPARMIERIEVIKGGGSALYGPGSVGGVVNVIPREPRRTGLFLETGIGMREDLPSFASSVSGDWVSADRDTFLTAFGQFDRVHPYDVDGDGFTEVARRDLDAFGARFNRYALAGSGKLTIDVTRLQEDRRGGDRLDLPPQEAFIAEAIDSQRTSASVGWLQQVHRDLDYTATASYAATARDSYYGTFMDPDAFGETDNGLLVFDGLVNRYVGHHVLSMGGQFSRDTLVDVQPAYQRLLDETYVNAGLFIQDDWSFASGWQLLAGARVDKHSEIDRVIASPRAVLMYSPNPAVHVRASLATGFRAPQAFDEDLHLSSVGGEVRIIDLDPELVEERSMNIMSGVEWRPTMGAGQGLFEVNGFHTRLTDLFHVQEDDDPATSAVEFVKTNFGGARVYGVELNAGWGIGDEIILQGGIVLQRSRFDEPEPDFGSVDFFRSPNRYGNLSATWDVHDVATFFLGMIYTGPMQVPHYAGYIDENRLEVSESFYVFDAFVTKPFDWRGRLVEITLGARNLTNAYQPDLDRGPLRDANYMYGPRFPRSLRVGVRASF